MRRLAALSAIQVLLLAVAAPAAALDLGQQPFMVRTVRQADAVHALAQTPDGMIWFGSRVGLARFDGERFVEVPLESGAPGPRADTWVRRLHASRDGSLWIASGAGALEPATTDGSQPGILARHGVTPALMQLFPSRPQGARDRIRRLSTADGLPSPWVWALADDRDGAMWVGTEGGLVRFAGSTVRRFSPADGLPANFITALAVAGDGTLYVGTTAGLAVRRHDRFQPLDIREPVIDVARDGAGRVWVAGHSRLWRLDPDGRRKSFAMDKPMAIVVDDRDQVWVGGYLMPDPRWQGASLSVFVHGEPRSLATPLTPYRAVTDLLIDREGGLWFSQREGGVSQLSSPGVRNLGVPEGLSGDIAYSVRRVSDGSIYVATTGGISRYLGGKWTTWAGGDDTIGGWPRDIAEGLPGARNAGVWFASEEHLLRGGAGGFRATKLVGPPFGKHEGSRNIIPLRDGDVVLARGSPVALLRLPGGDPRKAVVAFTADDGLCAGKLTHGIEARDGSLWFVGGSGQVDAGATWIKDGRARCFRRSDGLPTDQLGAVVEEPDGTIWLGTGWGAGLVRFRGGRFTTVPASVGLPRSSITGLLDDGRGFLWMCSETGVWRVPKSDLHRCADADADAGCGAVRSVVFGKHEGMRSEECLGVFHPNLTLDPQGNVWAATLGGVSLLAPPERAARPVLRPAVEEIAVDGVPVPVASTITLHRRRSLVVRYAVPTFVGAVRPRLRHRLVGFDAEWVSVPAPAVAHYHDLASGTYTLELAGGDGPAERTTLTIVAAPPFWRTTAFLVGSIVALAMVGLGLHLVRMGRLALRHRAANDERMRIARELHDGLAQKLNALGLLSDRLRGGDGGASAGDKLKNMRQIIHEAHAEVRRALWDLREGAEAVRVETLMERLLAQVVVPKGTEINLQTSGTSLPVPGDIARQAVLVAKEALVNALAHARARKIEIGVLSDEEGLHVWVADDGVGGRLSAEEAASRGHYGLLGMAERARQMGAATSIHSEPGEGTRVSLMVPRAAVHRRRS